MKSHRHQNILCMTTIVICTVTTWSLWFKCNLSFLKLMLEFNLWWGIRKVENLSCSCSLVLTHFPLCPFSPPFSSPFSPQACGQPQLFFFSTSPFLSLFLLPLLQPSIFAIPISLLHVEKKRWRPGPRDDLRPCLETRVQSSGPT